jgi:hypothetical protein
VIEKKMTGLRMELRLMVDVTSLWVLESWGLEMRAA